MAEERKALIEKIILKYVDGSSREIYCEDFNNDNIQKDMQLFTTQLLTCKYNGFSMQQKSGIDYQIENVKSFEFVFKPKY
ncbi:hypothetical protein ABFP60_19230 [Clostridioides difficile]